MPTPNYGYEKRQKELAKKRKNEEKLKLKAERKKGGPMTEAAELEPQTEGAPTSDAPDTPQA